MRDIDSIVQACREEIEQILSSDVILSNLHAYLGLDTVEDVTVKALDEFTNVRDVSIERKDIVTVLTKKIVFHDPRLGYAPLQVLVGIGDIEIAHGGFLVEKCTALLLYNHVFELMDVDFFCETTEIM